jgi:hypothetical protein
MNNLNNTLAEKMRIDHEIAGMKQHGIDYSDIPPRKPGSVVRLANKQFLDNLPRDLVAEMARRRLKELKNAGYEIYADAEEVSSETSEMASEKH